MVFPFLFMLFAMLLPFLFLMLIIGFALVGLAATVFWIWMIVDCIQYESPVGNDKVVWLLVILLTHFIGALIYFLVRRPERRRLAAEYSKGLYGQGPS